MECISPRMKKLLISVFALGLFVTAPTQAQDSPLAEQMDLMNDSYKMIRRNSEPEKNVEYARIAQQAMLKAITITPEFVETGGHPGPKDVAMATYRKQVGELFVLWCSMEIALLAEDEEQVKAIIELMKESKKTGHDEFMDEE